MITSPVVLDTTTIALTDLMTTAGSSVTSVVGWVSTVTQAILSNPLAMFTLGFLAVGGAIGIISRMISK